MTGFEPATPSSRTKCATGLRYIPKKCDKNNKILYISGEKADSICATRESQSYLLDKGLEEAREKGWTVIDMKTDWKVVYPFELD